jgi:hypothetical protein
MTKNIIVSVLVALVVSLGVGLVTTKPESTELKGLSERNVQAVTVTAGNITASDVGTSTVKLISSTSGRGGCIEMESTNGSTARIYLAATTTALTIATGTCE